MKDTIFASNATSTEGALDWSTDIEGVDWEELSTLYRAVLGNKPAEHLRTVFSNSQFRCFVRRQGRLIAAGRALADGRDVAYIADIAVEQQAQGSGIGRQIVQRLMQAARGHKKIILYSVPGKEAFYAKLGFKHMNTAMAVFVDEAAALRSGVLRTD
ncbi:MAG TPA: GNAT family N-acetyltransferase [Rubrivivax sp.]|nr:GNAT family N-acetyltransferase [Rubrivivax sp.]